MSTAALVIFIIKDPPNPLTFSCCSIKNNDKFIIIYIPLEHLKYPYKLIPANAKQINAIIAHIHLNVMISHITKITQIKGAAQVEYQNTLESTLPSLSKIKIYLYYLLSFLLS